MSPNGVSDLMSSTSRARRLVANLTIIGLAPAILAPPALAAGATTKRVSDRNAGGQSNGSNSDSAVSANGRFVAFESDAGNLVRWDRNGHFDVFVRGPLR